MQVLGNVDGLERMSELEDELAARDELDSRRNASRLGPATADIQGQRSEPEGSESRDVAFVELWMIAGERVLRRGRREHGRSDQAPKVEAHARPPPRMTRHLHTTTQQHTHRLRLAPRKMTSPTGVQSILDTDLYKVSQRLSLRQGPGPPVVSSPGLPLPRLPTARPHS